MRGEVGKETTKEEIKTYFYDVTHDTFYFSEININFVKYLFLIFLQRKNILSI